MHSLKQLQETFKRHLFTGDGGITAHIVDREHVSNEQRIATYSNAYYGRLVEALGGDYEALHVILGDDEFTALCHDYIHTYPSTHYSLRWFGKHLPQFIQHHRVSEGRAYLAELATLEWTFINAFDASDAEVLDETAITTIPADAWPGMKIQFHPSLHCNDHHWNILDTWRAARDKEQIPAPQALADESSYLVWRQALTTRYRILEVDEAAALKAAVAGAGFAQLLEVLMDHIPDDGADDYQVKIAMRGAGLLKTWLAEGLVVALL